MNVIESPAFGWLEKVFVCAKCGARVSFEVSDLGSVQVHLRPRETMHGTWAAHATCAVCKTPMANFTQEVEMPIPLKDDDQTLAPCVLCGRGYPPSAMWPRPDGFICTECSMKVPDDAQ